MTSQKNPSGLDQKMMKWALGFLLIFLSVLIPLVVSIDHQDLQSGIVILIVTTLLYSFIGGIIFSILFFAHAYFWKSNWAAMFIIAAIAIYGNSFLLFIMSWPGAYAQKYTSIVLLLLGLGIWIASKRKAKK